MKKEDAMDVYKGDTFILYNWVGDEIDTIKVEDVFQEEPLRKTITIKSKDIDYVFRSANKFYKAFKKYKRINR